MNTNWKRLVIKVGSALISPKKTGGSSQYLLSIANFIVRCRIAGVQVVLVSSGSVAAGYHLFKQADVSSLTIKKAMAAAGQSEMIATWDRLFDFNTAQVLLTHADLKDRARYESVQATIDALLMQNILPIVNENDAVTTDKLRIGDNDNLSAMVASAIDADALVICSDVNGLYDANPKLNPEAKLITDVTHITDELKAMAGDATSDVGTGGMITKLQAAEKATSKGVDTYIVNGFNEANFNQLLIGSNPGTHFHGAKKPLPSAKHWFKHATRVQGELVVENSFDNTLSDTQQHLSSEDLVEIKGEFEAGDVVMLRKSNGQKLAKVQTNYSSSLLQFITRSLAKGQTFNSSNSQILSNRYIDLTRS